MLMVAQINSTLTVYTIAIASQILFNDQDFKFYVKVIRNV